jgi:hypothetical protein
MSKRQTPKRPQKGAGAGSYEVGYGKPPAASQFRPGQSGNPRGRAKGTRNFRTDLEEELGEKVEVSENGKPIRLSKQRLMVKSLVTRAIKGDARATGILVGLLAKMLGSESGADETPELGLDDKAILAAFIGTLAQPPEHRSEKDKGKKDDPAE